MERIMKIELLKQREIPFTFCYPDSVLKIVELGLTNICPWTILGRDGILLKMKGLESRYSTRRLLPFAICQYNDDVACFEEGKGEEVQIIHDFAAEGWEQRGGRTYPNFWAWFKMAIDEMIEFD